MVLDMATGGQVCAAAGGSDPGGTYVGAACFSPDGDRLVTSAGGVFDARTARRVGTLDRVPGTLGAVAWTLDGRLVVGGRSERVLFVWDAATGRKLRTHRGHFDTIRALAVSPDGRHLASGGADRLVKVWDVATLAGPPAPAAAAPP